MLRRAGWIGSGTLVCTLAGACRSSTEVVCDTAVVSPLRVLVRDAASGAPIPEGTSGTARTGDRIIPLVTRAGAAGSTSELIALDGPAGRYEVRVRHAAYRDWVRGNVLVRGNRCRPTETVVLEARLEREPR